MIITLIIISNIDINTYYHYDNNNNHNNNNHHHHSDRYVLITHGYIYIYTCLDEIWMIYG